MISFFYETLTVEKDLRDYQMTALNVKSVFDFFTFN